MSRYVPRPETDSDYQEWNWRVDVFVVAMALFVLICATIGGWL